ncbi:hypothetical protein ACFL3S_04860 [Gemmatimonadota bacterium]
MELDERDLARTDPLEDPARWEALVRSIVEGAGPELARRRWGKSTADLISGWSRPVLSAAALLVFVSATLLFLSRESMTGSRLASDSGETPLLAEALVPEGLAGWLEGGDPPSLVEFVQAMEVREKR